MELEEIKKQVYAALDKLLIQDSFLLLNDVNERSITHKLAEYLSPMFGGWNVDCEYNRSHDDIKRLDIKPEYIKSNDTNAKTVFPDIIVHKRDTDENLLIIEIKKRSRKEASEQDKEKIRKFIEQLNYNYGLFIDFETGKKYELKEATWFQNKEGTCQEI